MIFHLWNYPYQVHTHTTVTIEHRKNNIIIINLFRIEKKQRWRWLKNALPIHLCANSILFGRFVHEITHWLYNSAHIKQQQQQHTIHPYAISIRSNTKWPNIQRIAISFLLSFFFVSCREYVKCTIWTFVRSTLCQRVEFVTVTLNSSGQKWQEGCKMANTHRYRSDETMSMLNINAVQFIGIFVSWP